MVYSQTWFLTKIILFYPRVGRNALLNDYDNYSNRESVDMPHCRIHFGGYAEEHPVEFKDVAAVFSEMAGTTGRPETRAIAKIIDFPPRVQ